MTRGFLRLLQSVAVRLGQPAGHRAEKLAAHTKHDLLKAGEIAKFILDGDEVLDVGCGSGLRLTELALFRRIHARGVDVRIDSNVVPGVDVSLYDGATIPFPDNSFDVVTVCYVLHHLRRDHVERLLSELRRVCRGTIVLLEDTMPRWSWAYKARNFIHRVESDYAYESESRTYASPGDENMFLTHGEWRQFILSVGTLGLPEFVDLRSISQFAHHALIAIHTNKQTVLT